MRNLSGYLIIPVAALGLFIGCESNSKSTDGKYNTENQKMEAAFMHAYPTGTVDEKIRPHLREIFYSGRVSKDDINSVLLDLYQETAASGTRARDSLGLNDTAYEQTLSSQNTSLNDIYEADKQKAKEWVNDGITDEIQIEQARRENFAKLHENITN